MRFKLFAAAFCAVLTVAAITSVAPAFAQTQALPTAPGADRATQGGLPEAPASLPKVAGASPLEPYLITWLLPVTGIIIFGFCVFFDRRLRTSYRG